MADGEVRISSMMKESLNVLSTNLARLNKELDTNNSKKKKRSGDSELNVVDK